MEFILVNYDDVIVVAGRPRGACEPRCRKGPKVKDNAVGVLRLNCVCWKSCVIEETIPKLYDHSFIVLLK